VCLGQVACQPALALAQGLGMGVDALHLRELQIVPEEQGLLHGHHAIVGLTPLHRLEDGGNGPLGQGEHGQAEL